MSEYQLRNMTPDDREEVATLIFHSTNEYYVAIGRDPIFRGDDLSTCVFFDVYEQLDPGQGIVAIDNQSGRIIGSCFVHPRETHVALGIMNAHHDYSRQGVARSILRRIIDMADAENKSVRLVSSCFNLDSYSLYTRAGFVPFCTYQDMYLEVPASGLQVAPPTGISARPAGPDDLDSMAAIEHSISGITRRDDYWHFIDNPDGLWHVSVVETSGQVEGFLVSCGAEALNMLGPGVARTQDQAAALIHAELNQHPGRTPLFLVPVNCGDLVRRLYTWGARNCELHVGQVHGQAQAPRGVTMPTFLPETG